MVERRAFTVIGVISFAFVALAAAPLRASRYVAAGHGSPVPNLVATLASPGGATYLVGDDNGPVVFRAARPGAPFRKERLSRPSVAPRWARVARNGDVLVLAATYPDPHAAPGADASHAHLRAAVRSHGSGRWSTWRRLPSSVDAESPTIEVDASGAFAVSWSVWPSGKLVRTRLDPGTGRWGAAATVGPVPAGVSVMASAVVGTREVVVGWDAGSSADVVGAIAGGVFAPETLPGPSGWGCCDLLTDDAGDVLLGRESAARPGDVQLARVFTVRNAATGVWSPAATLPAGVSTFHSFAALAHGFVAVRLDVESGGATVVKVDDITSGGVVTSSTVARIPHVRPDLLAVKVAVGAGGRTIVVWQSSRRPTSADPGGPLRWSQRATSGAAWSVPATVPGSDAWPAVPGVGSELVYAAPLPGGRFILGWVVARLRRPLWIASRYALIAPR